MGADVYLESVSEKLKKKFQPKFNAAVAKRDALRDGPEREAAQAEVMKYYDAMYSAGYFRDSYNPANLASLIDFSWWRDVVPMLNKRGYLSITQAKKFLRVIESKHVTREACEARKRNLKWNESVDELVKIYEERRQSLINILKQSIELKEPLYCSL